jgi:deoxyribose-phosphate aldolase
MDPDRRLVIACLDLTSLGDTDDDTTAAALCSRARRPLPDEPELHVAAVCVRPRFVALARAALEGSGVRVAAATGGFPDPSDPLARRLDEIELAIEDGAEEVDVVVNRRLLADPAALAEELAATRAAAAAATWKAILETGALTPDEIVTAARLAIDAGADFLKTSTGKGPPGATTASVETLAGVIGTAGRPVGLKVSGGVRTARDAMAYLGIVARVLGPHWAEPARFRIGASSLLGDLVGPPSAG